MKKTIETVLLNLLNSCSKHNGYLSFFFSFKGLRDDDKNISTTVMAAEIYRFFVSCQSL